MHNDNWDDLRYVLAVADSGSVLQAARQLAVNHATVLRRVSAFEERNGAPVFERTPQGYRLLPDQGQMIAAARAAKTALDEVDRLASGGRRVKRGPVRVTSTDTICTYVLPDFVATLNTADEGVDVTLLSSNIHLDLLREQAHVTVRPTLSLPEDLAGVKVAELGFAAYAAVGSKKKWLALEGPLARSSPAIWLDKNVDREDMTSASDSFITLRELAGAGEGIAILPCMLGDSDARLRRRNSAMPKMSVPLWIAQHVDAVETYQMRVVKSRLSEYLKDRKQQLSGR